VYLWYLNYSTQYNHLLKACIQCIGKPSSKSVDIVPFHVLPYMQDYDHVTQASISNVMVHAHQNWNIKREVWDPDKYC